MSPQTTSPPSPSPQILSNIIADSQSVSSSSPFWDLLQDSSIKKVTFLSSSPKLHLFVLLEQVACRLRWVWGTEGLKLTGITEVLKGKSIPVPLCPRQISHGLTRLRTRTSTMKGRVLTFPLCIFRVYPTENTFLPLKDHSVNAV